MNAPPGLLHHHPAQVDCWNSASSVCASKLVIRLHPAIGIVEIDLARCLAYTGVFCISCQGSCAYQAIQRDRLSRPQMLQDACTGCGACVSVCPVQAIKVSQRKFYVIDPTQPAN